MRFDRSSTAGAEEPALSWEVILGRLEMTWRVLLPLARSCAFSNQAASALPNDASRNVVRYSSKQIY
jgi:hypothetical protein